MKKNTTLLYIIVICFFLLESSCLPKDEQTYKITFITNQLGKQQEDLLPSEIWPILYPLTEESCEYSYRANNIQFYRGDIEEIEFVEVEIKPSGGQKYFGVSGLLQEDVENKLESEIEIGEFLSKKNENFLNLKLINELVGSYDQEFVFEVNTRDDAPSVLNDTSKIPFFNSIEELIGKVTSTVCNQENNSPNILILFNLEKFDSSDEPDDETVHDIASELNFVANRKGDRVERKEKSKSILLTHFEPDAKIIQVLGDGIGKPIGLRSGFPYVEEWMKGVYNSRTIEKVIIKEIKRSPKTQKISEMILTEVHMGEQEFN